MFQPNQRVKVDLSNLTIRLWRLTPLPLVPPPPVRQNLDPPAFFFAS